MFKKKDPNSFTAYFQLYNGTPGNDGVAQIGYLIAEYQVIRYDNVQVQNRDSINRSNNRNFLLHCTQRVVIANSLSIHPGTDVDKYKNYPVLINAYLNLTNKNENGMLIQVLEYSPHTVNTKIQQAGSTGNSAGQTSGTSKSSTVGSSTSETNSYGASVSVGLTELSDSASINYEHSSTLSQEQSSTFGKDSSTSSSQDSSHSASMSIKDWGAYGMVNPLNQNPNWIFGQEYPWDAIECRKTDGKSNLDNPDQDHLIVPTEMVARLFDGECVYPPSQLSLFGVNFVMKTLWLVTLNDSAPDDVTIEHNILYSTASHLLDSNKNVQVYVDGEPTALQCNSQSGNVTTNLNLSLVALAVLGTSNKPTIIGFIPKKFIVNPSKGPFKIISSSNTLLIEDTTDYGNPIKYPTIPYFNATETALTAAFSQSCTSLNVTAYFKVVDTVNDYKLYLKHWKTGATGVMLTITINGDADNSIIKYVDALEAEGGENNLLVISLRDQNYASVDYHDYLQLGLNSIQLTIEPIGGQYVTDCGYQIRAMSIEKV